MCDRSFIMVRDDTSSAWSSSPLTWRYAPPTWLIFATVTSQG
jgi:hypothetical protein